jgi:thiamine biosynthesis lipoprotein ApbE
MQRMRPPFHGIGVGCLSRARLAAALLICASAGWLALAQSQDRLPTRSGVSEFYFHHDHIIGTSLDVWAVAPNETSALACERVIREEIERLRCIFSTFDPDSEISRLNRTNRPTSASPEMLEVFQLYEAMQLRSHGAFNGQLGELVRLWRAAEKTGVEPDAAELDRIIQEINKPGWRIDGGMVTRLTTQPLNLNSIAKGYIIQKAAAAARARVPGLGGLLLNLGGDIAVWGQDAAGRDRWHVGIQDPFHPEENAEPLALFRLGTGAVATSGGYERFYTVGGKRYSHIFDPRTGRPATGIASATVVAADNVTANALATTLCVLTPDQGLRLVADTPGAECLLVAADGRQFRSAGMKALEVTPVAIVAPPGSPRADDDWPAGYQVSITLSLPMIDAPKYRRPYVAVWLENADGKPVRTITVWGNNSKYTKDLTNWWQFAKDDAALVKAVTRATRAPGKYTIVWDGKDDQGKMLPQGTYTIKVEVRREHGKHQMQTGKIECGANPATLTLDKNAETDATVVDYAKKK